MTYYVLYYFINTLITKIIRAVRDVRAAVEDRAAAADADDDRGAADEQGRLLGSRQRHVAQARRAGRAQGQALHARHPTHPPAGKYTKSATFCQKFPLSKHQLIFKCREFVFDRTSIFPFSISKVPVNAIKRQKLG